MEVTLTPFQAQVFNLAIARFSTLGVSGNSVFSDTYVLQKAVIDYISNNTITSGNANTIAQQVYNGVLGIIPPPPPAPATPAGALPNDPVTENNLQFETVSGNNGLGVSNI